MGLDAKTYILKSNGEKVQIRKIKVGEEIFGLDKDGFVVSNEVLSVEKGTVDKNWINLQGPRAKMSRGSSYYSYSGTFDQEVLIPQPYGKEKISNIQTNNSLILLNRKMKLTVVQKSILLGTILGDGTIKTSPSRTSQAVKWSHSDKQKDYLDWTIAALGGLAKLSESYTSGYGSKMHTALTKFDYSIMEYFSGFDKPSGVIPQWVATNLNPISFAYWYMDDGFLTHAPKQSDRMGFSTYSFNESAHEVLLEGLRKFSLSPVIQNSPKGSTIRLNSEDTDFFSTLIAPYVPPSMQYKLPESFRGNLGWIPNTQIETENQIFHGSVTRSSILTKSNSSYILKTQLGNFFANGVATVG